MTWLGHPDVGFLRIGYMVWSDGWGISWSFQVAEKRPGFWRYRYHGEWQIIGRAAWQDYGWWALWPIHFCRFMPGPFDPDVFDYDTFRVQQYVSSSLWTGRTSEIVAIAVLNRWMIPLPHRWMARLRRS